MSPLDFRGQQQRVQTLPQGCLPIFNGDGSRSPKRHMDQFLAMCDMHFINHDDILVTTFLQKLVVLASYWFRSLPTGSITCFDDLKDMFLTQYTHPIIYHTLLTKFTRIHLEKGERIRDFNLSYFRTVQ
jgi:hypothetical protein